ncbi:hypothetical protein GOBAR_AA33739 [Gossypium barbadense]|uniref:Uncharacterized protein n=1 Tax=Gossypium barbadense TaxID=3634 RepID=A0A2P5W773_GOSBA|nr:hypothetical protein GOBAR_AA33739 [Gossypium barbadense]
MGKKGSGWFSMVKKVFKSSSKDLPDKKATGYPTAPDGHPNSTGQEGQSSAMYDCKPAGGSTDETAVAVGNTAVDASKAAGCNYPLSGNVVNVAGNATTVENGNAFDN